MKKLRDPWMAILFGGLAAVLALLFVSPWIAKVKGADHREAPLINEDPAADLADVFVFLNPNNTNSVVFAMTVNGFAVPGVRASYSFSPDVLYQFKIDNNGDAEEDLVIQAQFEGFESARDPRCPAPGGGQFVTVLGPARPQKTGAVNEPLGRTNRDDDDDDDDDDNDDENTNKHPKVPKVTGCTNQNLGPSLEGLRVFAGLRDDPFVTDPGQLNRILGGFEQVFRQFTSPVLGALDGRTVDVNGQSGNDTFGGFNVSTLVVEVPEALVQGTAGRTGTYLQNNTTIGFWGTTSRQRDTRRFKDRDPRDSGRFVQIQRMGQTLIKTVFIPAAQRDRYNRSVPENDLADLGHFSVPADAPGFSRFIPDALTTAGTPGDPGNTIAARANLLTALGVTSPNGAPLLPGLAGLSNTNRNLIRHVIFPDVLRIDLGLLPPGDLAIGINGLQNGRRPDDDVTDILLRLARQLADVNFPPGSMVPGSFGSPRAAALNCTVLPNCPDRRVLAVLQGTDFIEPDADVANLANSGQDQTLLAEFPFFAVPHPLPGNPGTVGYPPATSDLE